MPSSRDLLEAQAFGRRRLVTAFACGAPGGREVEPARPGRPLVGGLAVAALLLAGAAVLGLLAPRTDPNWLTDGNLVTARTGGDLYLVRKVGGRPVLRPFVNAMSARLMLGEKETVKATAEDIAAVPVGAPVGIVGAPSQVAPPGALVAGGWTACTRAGAGVVVDLAADPAGTVVTDGAQVVRAGAVTYLVTDPTADPAAGGRAASAVAFPLAGRWSPLLLDQLGLEPDPQRVDPAWLGLLGRGQALAPSAFDVGRPGAVVAYAAAAGDPDLRVGQLAGLGDQTYLATERGLARLTPFALAVYRGLGGDGTVRPIARVSRLRTHAYPPGWPSALPRAVAGDPCARLETAPGAAPRVRVVTDPTSGGRLHDVPAGTTRALVDPGHGALVRTDPGGAVLISADGRAYAVVDRSGTTLDHLGYAGVTPTVVPGAWLRLASRGPDLSAELAGRTPPSG